MDCRWLNGCNGTGFKLCLLQSVSGNLYRTICAGQSVPDNLYRLQVAMTEMTANRGLTDYFQKKTTGKYEL